MRGTESGEAEASGAPKAAMSAETMEGGKLTNEAGMLLKNRAMVLGAWLIAIAKPSPKPREPKMKEVGEKSGQEG